MQRIDDSYDHRNHTAIGLVEGRAGTIPFPVDKYGITDTCVGIIQGDEIPLGGIARQGQGLYDQHTPILIIWVANGGNNSANYFSYGHFF